MKSFAAWRVEKGVGIAEIEQLLGSRAIGSTFMTLIDLRSYNLLGLLLVLLWAISPLGGQASLRTPSLEQTLRIESSNFTYFDWATPWDAFGGLVDAENRPIWAATYIAALAASGAVKRSSQDAYGNIKVPFIEAIDGYDTAKDGHWLPVPSSSDIEYSSLLGVPSSSQMSTANVSFNMESAYMTLACGNTSILSINDFKPPSDWFDTGFSPGLEIATDGSNGSQDTNSVRDISKPRQVWFNGHSEEGIAVTKCNLTTTYVELNISCIDKVCNAKAIRPSQLNNESSTWSVLDQHNNAPVFFGELVNASQSSGASIPSGSESYVLEPDNPFGNVLSYPDYSKVDSTLFSTRYSQLLNTYYACQLAPFAITGAATLPYNNSFISERYLSRNVDGTTFQPEKVFICHQGWLAIQLLSSLTMTLCGIISAIFTIMRRGPDILSSFSSLTRDNVFMAKSVPDGGSDVDGNRRARYLRNVKVMLGDVAPDRDIGHIALGTVETQKIGPLRRGRLYD